MVNNIVKMCQLSVKEQIQAGHAYISPVFISIFRKAKILISWKQVHPKRRKNRKNSASQDMLNCLLRQQSTNSSLKGWIKLEKWANKNASWKYSMNKAKNKRFWRKKKKFEDKNNKR